MIQYRVASRRADSKEWTTVWGPDPIRNDGIEPPLGLEFARFLLCQEQAMTQQWADEFGQPVTREYRVEQREVPDWQPVE